MNTIFVSIASYRDSLCSDTLQSLFSMAENPSNIFVGICLQNDSNDPDCIHPDFSNNIRKITIPHYEAKGPTYARYLCSTLCQNETFYMQIDSHTKFVKHWDTLCIRMINDIKSQGLSNKPVLSHYPKEYSTYDSYNESQKHLVPRMCKSFFNDRGMLSFSGSNEMHSNNTYYKTPYLASGMFFCESYFLKELPYDPNLDYLFVGEEILHSIRFFTNGWDIFTPSENIIFHYYTRPNDPKIWTDNPYYSDMNAFLKVKKYLELEDTQTLDNNHNIMLNFDKYGLGKTRSLQDYYDFAQIDVKNKKVYSDFCKPNNIDPTQISENTIEHFSNSTSTSISSNSNSFYFYIILFIIFIVILIIVHYTF